MAMGPQLDRDAPRFPDMPQQAIAPIKTPGFTLFSKYEHFMPQPIVVHEDHSKTPYIILLILGFVLMFLAMLD